MATRSLGTLTLDLIAKIGGYVAPLDQAARKTKKNTDDMKKDFKGLSIAVTALGAGAVVAFAAMAKSSINAADELSKTAQKVGVSVESLSALKFTAGLADVELGALTTSLVKFNKNIAEVSQGGTGPAANAFSDLGIELAGVDGQLKSTDMLFSEVADKLAMLEDGALKTALAQDILGKSGANLIPLLNGGAKGLRDGADEAQRLNQIIGTDAAKAAEQFNDNLTRLKASVTGISNKVAMDLVPDMADLTNILADPQTQIAIASLASGISEVVKVTAFAVTELSTMLRLINGFDSKNIAQLDEQILNVMDALENPSKRLRFFGKDGVVEYYSEEELNAELKKLLDQKDSILATHEANNKKNVVDSNESGTLTAEQIEANRKLREQREEAAKAAKKLADDQAAQVKKIQEDYKNVIASMEKQIALYGNTSAIVEARYDLEHGYLDGITEKEKQRYLQLVKQNELLADQQAIWDEIESFGGPDAVFADLPKEASEFAKDAAERIDAEFSNAWMNIDKGFEGLRDGIVDSFKRMLAEMAHEAVTKPIVMNIQQRVSGSGSINGEAAGGAISAGGWWGALALAVAAGANQYNKDQEKLFAEMTAEFRQGHQSTGTLLGIANAKSESISKLIDNLGTYADDSLGVNQEMLLALIDIREGIGGMAAGFARQFGIAGVGDSLGMQSTGTFGFNDSAIELGDKGADLYFAGLGDEVFGNEVRDFVKGFMGGVTESISKNLYSKKVRVIDSGIIIGIGNTLADLMAGGTIDALAYADVRIKKKALGVTTSNKVKTQTEALNDILLGQFSDIFAGAGEALDLAAGVFGIDFDKYLEKLKIDPKKLSLKGLEGDALTAEIEAFFSSTLDGWASVLIDGTGVLEKFQEVGEGAFETMLRVAGETEAFAEAADKLGFNFDVVGIAAVEAVQYLADAAGGFDALSQSVSNYAGKFLSDAERVAAATKVVDQEFGKLGIAVPKTREEFTALVQGLDLTTESGREQFATLMRLVDVTDSYISSLDKETKAKEEAAKAAIGVSFDALNRAVQAERDVMDKINQTALDALQKSLTEHQSVANSLASALGSMSLESSRFDLVSRRAAQAQVIAANAIARAGGPLPGVGQLDAALQALARPSEQLYSNFEDYARDFYATQKSLQELQEAANGQVSIDEQNLKAQEAYHAAELDRLDDLVGYYQDQINVLNGIDTSVLTVADAINKLNTALLVMGVNAVPPAAVTSAAQSASMVATSAGVVLIEPAPMPEMVNSGYVVADLLDEIKSLREDLEASQFSIANNTQKTSEMLLRWDVNGLPQEREA